MVATKLLDVAPTLCMRPTTGKEFYANPRMAKLALNVIAPITIPTLSVQYLADHLQSAVQQHQGKEGEKESIKIE